MAFYYLSEETVKKSLTLMGLFCASLSWSSDNNISFLNHKFDPLVKSPIGTDLKSEKAATAGLKFIQFNGKIKQNWLTQLKNQGVKIIQYYPDNTYLVWASGQQVESLESLNHVRWTGEFSQAFKFSENLKGKTGVIKNIDVHFYNSGNPQSIISQLEQIGANVEHYYSADTKNQTFDAIIQLDADSVKKIGLIPEVIWAGYQSDLPILDDESTSQTVAGNLDLSNVPELNYTQWLTDIGLDGSGVIWSITDTGVDYTHGDLNTRIVGGYNYPGCEFTDPGDDPGSGGHGTHVAGITGGDATGAFTDADGYLYGLGVAPAYSIFAQNPICGTQNSWPPVGGWQELSKQGVLGGAVGSNNSWTSGEGANHGYQATERTIDMAVRDGNFDTPATAEEFIWVFSAGNSGPGASTLTSPKEAKNVIVTASTDAYRVSGNVDAMSGFSSRGPSVDGRYVPTIAAPGGSIGSTRNDDGGSCGTAIPGTNDLYSLCSGTSMAAPHASGALVLITQWWKQNNAGENPSAAMGKALLVNTAVDIDDGVPIPNFNEGWGRINLKNLFQAETAFNFLDQSYTFDNTGETWQVTRSVDDANKPLRISVAWSDAAGAIGANPALVNDLDLEVTTGGQTYFGNQFNNGTSVVGGSSDTINNIENVFIENPGNSVTIKITATNIAGDGVVYSGDDTDQDFAFVCGNCSVDPDFEIDTTPSNLSVCSPSDAIYGLNVVGISGYTDPVDLSTVGTPANATVNFGSTTVTPGNSTTLTLSSINSVAPGDYNFDVQGQSTTGTKNYPVSLSVFGSTPGQVTLTDPSDNELNVDLMPTFTWQAISNAASYLIEIDDDINFGSVDYSMTTTEVTHSINTGLNSNTVYYWRVSASNTCGDSIYSDVFTFTTYPAPGDCSIGSTAQEVYAYGFENGLDTWSAGTNIPSGPDTWSINTTNPHSGTNAMHAENVAEVGDQILTSPEISIPNNLNNLTMQFWNNQIMEDGTNICYDGGLLFVSTDGGSNFNQVENSKLVTDPYDFGLSAQYSNPHGSADAWCGDPQDWLNSVIDINDYSGQNVIFRFHLATDSTVSHEGWYIDDFKVQGCAVGDTDLIFENGFEAPAP